ncbi:hypothetical protein EXIGLDRAFT_436304 [Exidia glandulosa HHB12029]|uniref:Uncharacterized protein n=1 Tax=Exidia glandulosa HHB12029 TaxID=1314781 RepID=A0A165B8U1_EXIGL|nr:hypothetical protein EXIGLDRAFT_436304 [Exidia glandulosa HHB12029]
MPSGSSKTKSPTGAATARRTSSSPTATAKKTPAKERAAQEAAAKAAKGTGRATKGQRTAAEPSSPTTSESSSASSKKNKKKNSTAAAALEDEVAKLKEQLEAEKVRRRKAELQLPSGAAPAAAADSTGRKWRPIDHPGGSAGDDWSLQTKMHLDGRDKRYNALRVRYPRSVIQCRTNVTLQLEVKRCVDMSGLDFRVHMNKLDREKLGMVCTMAREHQPYLARFTGDWATVEFIRMLFKNRRQQARIRAAAEKAARAARRNGGNGEEDSEQDSGEEDSQAGSGDEE